MTSLAVSAVVTTVKPFRRCDAAKSKRLGEAIKLDPSKLIVQFDVDPDIFK